MRVRGSIACGIFRVNCIIIIKEYDKPQKPHRYIIKKEYDKMYYNLSRQENEKMTEREKNSLRETRLESFHSKV